MTTTAEVTTLLALHARCCCTDLLNSFQTLAAAASINADAVARLTPADRRYVDLAVQVRDAAEVES